MTKTVVITGANRGIGLAMAREFNALNYNVIALCRQSSPSLRQLGLTTIEDVDVATSEGRDVMVAALGLVKIDILINNAGILRDESLGDLNSDTIREQFEVNACLP